MSDLFTSVFFEPPVDRAGSGECLAHILNFRRLMRANSREFAPDGTGHARSIEKIKTTMNKSQCAPVLAQLLKCVQDNKGAPNYARELGAVNECIFELWKRDFVCN